MGVNLPAYRQLRQELDAANVTLVAVSKIKPVADIQALYDAGQRDFGENYVQELADKQPRLPADIRWHFIGHLQSNKVKYIAPFVHLIHGIDKAKLLQEISKQAIKHGRVIDCLLQVHIAVEETKHGMDAGEVREAIESARELPGVRICGLMGMASFTEDQVQLQKEFDELHALFTQMRAIAGEQFNTLSMGMSGDYKLAISCGSNMVRVGSLLFGARS